MSRVYRSIAPDTEGRKERTPGWLGKGAFTVLLSAICSAGGHYVWRWTSHIAPQYTAPARLDPFAFRAPLPLASSSGAFDARERPTSEAATVAATLAPTPPPEAAPAASPVTTEAKGTLAPTAAASPTNTKATSTLAPTPSPPVATSATSLTTTVAAPPSAVDRETLEAAGLSSIRAFERDWQCPFFPEFCNEVQQVVRRGRGDLGLAIRPHGHVSDLARLFARMDDVRRAGRVSIAVLGNSITGGCHGVVGSDWSHRLQTLLRADADLNLTVDLQWIHGGGANMNAVFEFISRMKDPDVVIIDLSMGDNDGPPTFLDRRLGRALRILLGWPSRPAVFFHEYAPHSAWVPLVIDRKVKVCDMDITTFGHFGSLRSLGVPVFSYFDLACMLPKAMLEKWVTFEDYHQRWNRWFDDVGKKDYDASAISRDYTLWRQNSWNNRSWPMYCYPVAASWGSQHPTCDWHEVVAHVFALMLRQALLPSERGLLAMADAQGGAFGGNATASDEDGKAGPMLPGECWTSPGTRLYINSDDEGPPFAEAQKSNIVPGFHQEPGPPSGHFPAMVEDSSWVWATDSQRPGWIAVPGRTGRIRFRVNASKGFVGMWYLETYENIGVATCRLGDGQEVKVDPHISERISVSGMQSFSISLASRDACVVDLECRTEGQKFKITGVQAC